MPGVTRADLDNTVANSCRTIGERSDPDALARLLEAWMEGDEAEQRETFEFLRQALDEDRPPGYKLFP